MTQRMVVEYPIDPETTREMVLPAGSNILSVGEYLGNVVLYVLINPVVDAKLGRKISLCILETGIKTEIDPYVFSFLGTINHSRRVYHVFYRDDGYYGVLPR